MRRSSIKHEFVECIPDVLEDGTVYVSIRFATVSHKCMCGCGSKVVTPLSPTGWELRFDGKTISLDPSIGSWNLPCKSHYLIRRSRIIWARKWSAAEIDAGREAEKRQREEHFGGADRGVARPREDGPGTGR